MGVLSRGTYFKGTSVIAMSFCFKTWNHPMSVWCGANSSHLWSYTHIHKRSRAVFFFPFVCLFCNVHLAMSISNVECKALNSTCEWKQTLFANNFPFPHTILHCKMAFLRVISWAAEVKEDNEKKYWPSCWKRNKKLYKFSWQERGSSFLIRIPSSIFPIRV